MYLNKVMLYGNLTRDPELRTLPSGAPVTNFSIATNRTFKDRDGNRQEQTEFHNIVVFGRQAETVSQYLKKGSAAYVEGRLQTRSWDKDGQKQYRTEVIADTVQFGPRGGNGSGGEYQGASAPAAAPAGEESFSEGNGSPIDYPADEINPDDIPF
ncbi:MAG TPA: single-stranded DNA-binding protein [Candidatus Paceibacterota bacterium]|nr:single-stranded DNA-binding protein [Candidatus Paceibacterota bacterium]